MHRSENPTLFYLIEAFFMAVVLSLFAEPVVSLVKRERRRRSAGTLVRSAKP